MGDGAVNPIFLLVGPPAVGKSTTARALAGQFPRSIYIPVDDIRTMVVSGLVLPGADWSDALVEQVTLARSSVAQMALNYHRAGFAVVVDDFWDVNLPADYHALFEHPALKRVVLYPDQDEAHRRNLKRSGDSPARAYIDEGIRIVYGQLNPVIDDLAQDGWQVLDSTRLSLDEVVSAIRDRSRGAA